VNQLNPTYSRRPAAAILAAFAIAGAAYAVTVHRRQAVPDNPAAAEGAAALAALERRIATGQATADEWVNYGTALAKAGRSAQAAEAFDAAIRLEPYHRVARVQRALALAASGQTDALLDHMKDLTLSDAKLAAEVFARPELRRLTANSAFANLAQEARDQAND
jgi:tetratricopeptide (TPR) repeat protein